MGIVRYISERYLVQGGCPPVGYGVAWWAVDTREAVCAPIPLNWVMGWARGIYFGLMRGPWLSIQEKAYHAGFEAGRRSGYIEGQSAGLQEFEARLAQLRMAVADLRKAESGTGPS